MQKHCPFRSSNGEVNEPVIVPLSSEAINDFASEHCFRKKDLKICSDSQLILQLIRSGKITKFLEKPAQPK